MGVSGPELRMAASCVLERVGRVAVLRMVKGENRINYEFMRNITELLQDAEKYDIDKCCQWFK